MRRPPPSNGRSGSPAPWGTASKVAIPAFAAVYLLAALVWRVPHGFAALYGIASVICFGAYAIDKSAAMAGHRRISERTLLLLGLVGGWPGAVLAQQMLRHKSSKASFRAAFWGTVVLNVLAFVTIHSPFGQALVQGFRV